MIFVIATVELVEGRRPEYLLELRKMIPVVRAEKGCLEYGGAIDVASGLPVQEPVDENAVVIIERWADADALKAHQAAEHMKTYRAAIKDYVKQVKIRVLAPA